MSQYPVQYVLPRETQYPYLRRSNQNFPAQLAPRAPGVDEPDWFLRTYVHADDMLQSGY